MGSGTDIQSQSEDNNKTHHQACWIPDLGWEWQEFKELSL